MEKVQKVLRKHLNYSRYNERWSRELVVIRHTKARGERNCIEKESSE
jgi:hypothetical protein